MSCWITRSKPLSRTFLGPLTFESLSDSCITPNSRILAFISIVSKPRESFDRWMVKRTLSPGNMPRNVSITPKRLFSSRPLIATIKSPGYDPGVIGTAVGPHSLNECSAVGVVFQHDTKSPAMVDGPFLHSDNSDADRPTRSSGTDKKTGNRRHHVGKLNRWKLDIGLDSQHRQIVAATHRRDASWK